MRYPHPALLVAVGATLAGLAGCTQVEEEPVAVAGLDTAHQCFFTRNINGYSAAPDGPRGQERVYIETGVNDRWLFEVYGSCPELDWAQQIALDTRSRSSICTGATETLLVPSYFEGRMDRCAVRLLGKMAEGS